MKSYTLIFISILLGTTLIFACTKVAPPCCTCEVPYSETGANTLGCLMDGVPWAVCDVAKNKLNYNTFVTYTNSTGYNYYKITCSKSFNGGFQNIYIHLWNPQIGLVSTNIPTYGSITSEFHTRVTNDYKGNFKLDTSRYSRLEITRFDTIQRIISGRFECTLKRTGSIIDTTTIKLTNGIFDVKY